MSSTKNENVPNTIEEVVNEDVYKGTDLVLEKEPFILEDNVLNKNELGKDFLQKLVKVPMLKSLMKM